MKKIFLLCSAFCLVFLVACSSNTSSQNAHKKNNKIVSNNEIDNSANVFDKAITVNGIELTIHQNKSSEIKKSSKIKQLYSFSIQGKNIGAQKTGLGSIDFVLVTKDGKGIKVDDSLETFGNEIEKNKVIKGPVYFSVAKNASIKSLCYKPGEKILAKWNVK